MNVFVIIVLGLGCAAAQEDVGCVPQTEVEEAYREVISGMNYFAFNLYQEVRANASGNLVMSPLSAAVVLSLTWMGTRQRSAQQLGDTLHLPVNRSLVAESFHRLMNTLPTAANQSDEDVLLLLANKVYIQIGFDIIEDFLHTAVKDFRSGVEQVNFADSENARNTINQWVTNHTNDRIQDLIPEDALSGDSRLVLVNALLFEAMWMNQFDKNKTCEETFFLSDSEYVNVSMMHGTFPLGYAELPDFNATVLQLPYQSNGVEADMIILLPNSVTGIEFLEEQLGQLIISNIQFQTKEVIVHLPSFTIETTVPMKSILKKLGVKDIFGSGADLTGISKEPLTVSDVLHKGFITVNENGTEAAAATAVIIGESAVVLEKAEFAARNPFLYILRMEKTVVVMGRVVNPNQ